MLARLVGDPASASFEHIVLPLRGGGGVEARVRDAGVLVPPLRVDGLDLPTAAFRLARRLRRLRPDLVQGWLLQGNLAATIGTGLAQLRIPVLWNVRWTIYDLESERFRTRALLRLSGRLSRHATRIVYNSRLAVPQHTAIGFPPDRAVVIPNGFDVQRLKPDPTAREAVRRELEIPEGATVVGMLARFHPMKDHVMSLHAAARVLKRGVDAVFVYAGRDVDNANVELVSVIRQLGLGDRVRLLGERQNVAPLYASFDLYWMSSWASGIAEGFPNVVAEAMACGVPCVATDSGDAAWLIGESGRVVPTRDPRALGDAVADLAMAGPDALSRMGTAARSRIERDFSLKMIIKDYEELYGKVLYEAAGNSRFGDPTFQLTHDEDISGKRSRDDGEHAELRHIGGTHVADRD